MADDVKSLAADLVKVAEEEIEKAGEGNPNHDAKGLFSSGSGGGKADTAKTVKEHRDMAEFHRARAGQGGKAAKLHREAAKQHDAAAEFIGRGLSDVGAQQSLAAKQATARATAAEKKK